MGLLDRLRQLRAQHQCLHGIPASYPGARPGVSYVTALILGGDHFEPERLYLCRPELGGCGKKWIK